MPIVRRQFLRIATGAAALPLCPSIARAQAFPSHPIIIVVPFTAGGPNDAVGRIIAERTRASLGQPVLVENVPGAAGSTIAGVIAEQAFLEAAVSLGGEHVHGLTVAAFDQMNVRLLASLAPPDESALRRGFFRFSDRVLKG